MSLIVMKEAMLFDALLHVNYIPPEIAQLQKWPWTNCSCVTALRNADAHAHKCSVWRFLSEMH